MKSKRLNRVTNEQRRRGWCRFSNTAGTGERPARIDIYDEIGYWGMSAGQFIDNLRGVTADEIELRVNSPGGEIHDGFAMYNALAAHPSRITAYVDGLAASAASYIVQAADTIICQESSQMMVHDGIGMVFGNAKDMRTFADQLDQLSGMIANIYAARSGIDASAWRNLMLAETWFTAQEAVTAGLADEVQPMKRRSEGSRDSVKRDEVDPIEALLTRSVWDLSPFRFAGRNAAPAPTVAGNRASVERLAAGADDPLIRLLNPQSSPIMALDAPQETSDLLSALRG